MSQARRLLGDLGERAALTHLNERGYRLLQRNYRRKDGEVDLILLEQDTLVFCEVKTRRSELAYEHYSLRQRQRMRRMVLAYLARSGWEGPVRVDLIAIEGDPSSPGFQLHHLQDVLSDDQP